MADKRTDGANLIIEVSIKINEHEFCEIKNSFLAHRFINSFSRIMYNYKNKVCFVSPEMPKSWANKTSFNIMIVHFNILRKNTMLDIIFQYG